MFLFKNKTTLVLLFALLFITFADSCVYELASDTPEGFAARGLRLELDTWSKDGCPWPPVSFKYVGNTPFHTNFTYTQTLVISNYVTKSGIEVSHSFQGVFAFRMVDWSRILVITTNGEIMAVEDSGKVRLIELGDCTEYKPR